MLSILKCYYDYLLSYIYIYIYISCKPVALISTIPYPSQSSATQPHPLTIHPNHLLTSLPSPHPTTTTQHPSKSLPAFSHHNSPFHTSTPLHPTSPRTLIWTTTHQPQSPHTRPTLYPTSPTSQSIAKRRLNSESPSDGMNINIV